MRHSRRAVMAEQYKLYIRRNIFNGKYFVRNIEIAFCVIVAIAVAVGTIVLINTQNTGKETAGKATEISAKEALFGSNDVTEAEITAATTEKSVVGSTEAVTEDATEETTKKAAKDDNNELVVTTEAVSVMSEITSAVDKKAEAMSQTAGINALENNDVEAVGDAKEEAEDEGEFADRCIANVDETLNIRKEPSRDAEFVGMMSKGSIATVVERDGEWIKIKSGDVEGYVLSEFVLTGKIAEEYAKNYVTLLGKALEDGVNIRADRSTEADILKVLDKDDTISVLEMPEQDEIVSADNKDELKDEQSELENAEIDNNDKKTGAEDITWITVMLEDGQIGYVSQEFVEVDKLYTLAVSAEELQRREEERAAAERAAAEAALQAAAATAAAAPSASNDSSSSYQGAKTTPITAASSGESLGTFYITAYCGCSKCSGGHNKTASGTTPTQGRTIAADTSILPFGTQVVIDGIVYTVEDRGSGIVGNHIDIFFATHEDATAYGSKSVTVYKY